MIQLQLTRHNLQSVFDELQAHLVDHPVLILEAKSGDTGKWGMARLWRAWMDKTAEHLASTGITMPLCITKDGEPWGKRPFDHNDAHEMFTMLHLGCDKDGYRLSWSRAGRDGMRAATKPERWLAMSKHEAWASERGIQLLNPRDSEYRQISEAQEQ